MPLDTQQFPTPSTPADLEAYRQPIGPMGRIIAFVAAEYGVPVRDILRSHERQRDCEPRNVARWLCRRALLKSWTTIGVRFRCDHCTVMSAYTGVRERRARDAKFRARTDDLLARAPQ